MRAENARLLAENTRLRAQLEAARRAGKRQAAPFSKGDPKTANLVRLTHEARFSIEPDFRLGPLGVEWPLDHPRARTAA